MSVLCWYSEEGDLQGVKRCIEENGADINYTDHCGESALIKASLKGYLEIVKYLISKGADMNLGNYTALIWASIEGHLEIVKVLVEAGADLNIKESSGNTALIKASQKGYFEIVKVLVEGGADVNIRNKYDKTALECSATDEIWDYLEAKTNDINLNNALCNFIRRNNLGKVKYLVEKRGADINANNGEPLQDACLSEDERLEMVKYLVEHGANVNAKDEYGHTALSSASSYGNLEVMKYLLANSAIIDGYVLYITAFNGQVEAMKLLIENGADINSADIKASNEYGDTALITALKWNKPKTTQLLIENGADIYAKNNEGKSALDYAESESDEFMGFL